MSDSHIAHLPEAEHSPEPPRRKAAWLMFSCLVIVILGCVVPWAWEHLEGIWKVLFAIIVVVVLILLALVVFLPRRSHPMAAGVPFHGPWVARQGVKLFVDQDPRRPMILFANGSSYKLVPLVWTTIGGHGRVICTRHGADVGEWQLDCVPDNVLRLTLILRGKRAKVIVLEPAD